MSSIYDLLAQIKNAVYGKDVRDAIHDSIEQCYDDATGTPESIAGAVADIQSYKEQTDALISNYESQFNTMMDDYEDRIDAQVDNLVANVKPNTVVNLWRGTGYTEPTGTIDDVYTLSDDISNYDYIEIYAQSSYDTPVRVRVDKSLGHTLAKVVNVQSSGYPHEDNTFYLLNETHIYFAGNGNEGVVTYTLQVTTRNGEQTTYEYNDPDMAPLTIVRIDGIKVGADASAEVADIRVGEDGTVYQTAGAAVRGQIADVKQDLAEFKYGGGGLTDEARYALLACFEQIAWIGNDGQDYYDALASALFPVAELTSISAVYTQSGNVYFDDNLNVLKPDLVVTAHYDDSSSQTIPTYILSGTLEAGTSTITVSFGGKTTTFDVIVKGVPSTYQMYDYITSAMNASANFAQTDLIKLKTYADLNTLSCEFWYRAESSHTTGSCIWGRRNGSGYTNSYAFYANNGYLGYHLHGVDGGTSAIQSANGALHHVTYNNPSASPSTVYSDDKSKSVVWSNSNVLNLAPTILTNAPDDSSASGVGIGIKCGRIRFYDYDGTRISDYIPCVRTADSVLGMYDIIDGVFYTASDSASCTVGGANVKYSIGNWS